MTAPARITQSDLTRAAKAARDAGWTNARIVVDLKAQRLEIVLGDAAPAAVEPSANPWDEV